MTHIPSPGLIIFLFILGCFFWGLFSSLLGGPKVKPPKGGE